MARKASRKAKAKGGGPLPVGAAPPPDKALSAFTRREKALGKRLQALERDLRDLTASILRRDGEHRSRESQEYQKIYARLAAIDGREERLKAAIDAATKAAKVLERVELGLRPMLVKALETDTAERQPPAIPRTIEPVDHIERYYKHLAYQSSLRS